MPGESIDVPPDLLKRLAALNLDPMVIRHVVLQNGVAFLPQIVAVLEERSNLYQEWSPRLRAFGAACRKSQPLPTDDLLSNCDRGKQQVYEAILKPVLRQPMHVAICCMPLIAMPVAHRLWEIDDNHNVLLTPEEESRWNELYSDPFKSFVWSTRYSWIMDDFPKREISYSEGNAITRWDENELQEGEQPWLVHVGQGNGPLSGAGHTELWSWNGLQARFIKTLSHWIS
jgi:hypothetical protein